MTFPHNFKGRALTLGAVIVVFFSLAVALYFVLIRDGGSIDVANPEETTDSRTKDERQKQLERDTNASLEDAQNPAPAPLDSPVTAERPDLEVAIESLSQDNTTVQFSIRISSRPDRGECVLRLERQGYDRVEKTIPLERDSCENESLSLPSSARGEWVATAMVISDGVVASDTRTISVR